MLEPKLLLLAFFLLALWLPTRATWAIEVRSDQPGHVFIEGQPIRFTLTVAEGEIPPAALRVVDYDGQTVAEPAWGETLALPALPRGYYELRAGEEKRTSFAVVVDPADRVPGDTRLAADCAHSWLIRDPEQYDEAAELVRRAGFPWVRERLSWGEVEPERGVFHWGRYDRTADEAAQRGIKVYQVFHSIPGWARADGNWKAYPDDLRDVFNFARATAEHFKGRVQAWEVWNEADIAAFSEELADEYAAFHKAAALGFKAGDPEVRVLMVSLALGPGPFADHIFRNGIAPYTGLYNWHIYASPPDYVARARAHHAVRARYGIADRPNWLTEAGIPLRDQGGGLSPEDERRQAGFIPRSFVYSLASGVDKHFWFVFPYYLENGIDFGSLNPDLTPKPGYVALATITYALGRGDYLGRLDLSSPPYKGGDRGGVSSLRKERLDPPQPSLRQGGSDDDPWHAHLFDRGDGSHALVLWAEGEETEVTLPLGVETARRLSVVGTETVLPTADGQLAVTLTREPFYLLLTEDPLAELVTSPGWDTPLPGPLPAAQGEGAATSTELPGLVLRWRFPPGTAQKASEAYVLPVGEPVNLELQVYNFGAEPFDGTVEWALPEGWTLGGRQPGEVALPAPEVRVEPLGLATMNLTLTLTWNGTTRPQSITAVARSNDRRSTPAMARVRPDPTKLEPQERLSLEVSEPAHWQDNLSANGTMSHDAGPDGGVRFAIRFTEAGDRWAYPFVPFDPPLDLSGSDGLALEYRCDTEAAETVVRVQFVEPNGAAYYTPAGFPARTEWQRVVVLFEELQHGSWSSPDANERLDLDRIAALRVGVNTPRDAVALEVRQVEAVRF